MSGLAIWAAFIVILILPVPGGGRLSSLAFADANGLAVVMMLALVIAASVIESFLFMVLPARWGWLKRHREKAKKISVMKQFTRATQPHWRYATLAGLPFFPLGGGTLIAFGAAHIWEIHPKRAATLIGSMNFVAFTLYLFLAAWAGWIVIGLMAAGALAFQRRIHLIRLANWSRPKLAALSWRT